MSKLSDIMSRHRKATKGEWEARSRTEDDGDYPFTTYYVWSYPFGRDAGPVGICECIMRPGDSDFVAHAREDIGWLLNKLNACQTELAAEKVLQDNDSAPPAPSPEHPMIFPPQSEKDVDRTPSDA
jgi:hypothetical protein